MIVLKGIALGLFGFFLCLVLPFLGIAIAVNCTLLNPQFMVSEIEKLDINSVAHQAIADQLPSDYRSYLPVIDATLVEIKPWVNQQIHEIIYRSNDYILGKTSEFKITVSTASVTPILVNNLTQSFLQAPPSEYLQLTSAQKSQYLAEFQQQLRDAIPSTLEINQDMLGAEGAQMLQQARELAGYVRSSLYVLAITAAMLILLMILIIRNKKVASRSLGIIFLIEGAFGAISFFTAKHFVPPVLPLTNLPGSVQSWSIQFVNDLILPVGVFCLSLLAVGIALVIVSFFIGAKQTGEVITPAPVNGV
jgi:hypothetical protein